MPSITQTLEHTIHIDASVETVDHTICDRHLMHQWLNPTLRCDPVGEWSTTVGAKSRFIIQIPLFNPTLESTVIERRLGLVVWSFDGFFKGTDRWECLPTKDKTKTCLINRFEFQIPNPLIAFGFKTFAARWSQKDMQAQLTRLKRVAESSSKR